MKLTVEGLGDYEVTEENKNEFIGSGFWTFVKYDKIKELITDRIENLTPFGMEVTFCSGVGECVGMVELK